MIAATIKTASRTTASLSDAKKRKNGFFCQTGPADEFELAMRRSTSSARIMPRSIAELAVSDSVGSGSLHQRTLAASRTIQSSTVIDRRYTVGIAAALLCEPWRGSLTA